MLRASFSVTSGGYEEESPTPAHSVHSEKNLLPRSSGPEEVGNVEMCALATPLLEEGPVLHHAMRFVTSLAKDHASVTAQCTPSGPPSAAVSSRDDVSALMLKWSALEKVGYRGIRGTDFCSGGERQLSADFVLRELCPPISPFLCVYHAGHPNRLRSEMENLLLWGVMSALRWALWDVVDRLAAIVKNKELLHHGTKEAVSETSFSVERKYILAAVTDAVDPVRQGFAPGTGTGKKHADPSPDDGLLSLQVITNAIVEDCTWSARPRLNSDEPAFVLLHRVRWTSTLVRSLATLCILRRNQRKGDTGGSLHYYSPFPIYCTGPPPPLKKESSERDHTCLSVTITHLSLVPHSRYLHVLAADVASRMFDTFIRQAERHRDDGSDHFTEAQQTGRGEEKEKELLEAIQCYKACAKTAKEGLTWPISRCLLDEPSRRGEDACGVQERENYHQAVQRSREVAVRRQAVDAAVEALWRDAVFPCSFLHFQDSNESDNKNSASNSTGGVKCTKSEVEELLAQWFRSVGQGFQICGASQPHRWESLLRVQLDRVGWDDPITPDAHSTEGPGSLGFTRALHDSIAHHVAVRPAVAAMQWRERHETPLPSRTTPSTHGEGVWGSLIPPPTVLEYIVYSLMRLLVVGVANAAQCWLQLCRVGGTAAADQRLLEEAASACDRCAPLLRQHLLVAHRQPVSRLHQLLAVPSGAVGAGPSTTPFRLRLLLHSFPLPPHAGDPDEVETEDSAAYKELRWCFQMNAKLLVRSHQLWSFSGNAGKAKEAKTRMIECRRKWAAVREKYFQGESPAGEVESLQAVVRPRSTPHSSQMESASPFEGEQQQERGESGSPELADSLIIRLSSKDWGQLEKDILVYM